MMAPIDEDRVASPLSRWAWAILLGATGLIWAIALLLAKTAASDSTWYLLPAMLVLAQMAVLLCIPGVQAIVRQTFSQCLRMKIAAAFVFLLAVALAVTSTQMKGDGTLAGQVRTFLSYSTSITGFLLSFATVLMGAVLISHDVRNKTVFSLAVKPLPRWQYVLGRWLGLVLFDAILLAISAAMIYGVSQYLRYQSQIGNQDIAPRDRTAAETEVFSSRRKIAPVPFDIEAQVQERYNKKKEEGSLASALEAYRARSTAGTESGKNDDARKLFDQEIRKQVLAPFQAAAPFPNGMPIQLGPRMVPLNSSDRMLVGAAWDQGRLAPQELKWDFKNISLAGAEVRGVGKVLAGRSANQQNSAVVIPIRCPAHLAARLIYLGPVRVNNLDGTIQRLGEDWFWVEFTFNDQTREEINALAEGQEARVVIPPTIQVSFKANPIGSGNDDTIRGLWIAENPENPKYRFMIFRDDPSRAQSTLTFPAKAVDSKGRMKVHFVNRNGFTVEIKPDDVAVMYREGPFEWNFIRGIALIMVRLMYIAALSVLAGSALSFPVACFVTVGLIVVAFMLRWVGEMIASNSMGGDTNVFILLSSVIVVLITILLPDFMRTSPVEAYIGGLTIPWGFVGETAVMQLAVRALLLLGLACWLFHRRELARVQV